MNMEWVKHVKMTNHHGPRVIVAQTCGMGKYEELLKETRLVNEKYARAHGYDYLAVIGLYSGTTEWHSTFNKAFVLESVLRAETHYDLLFYLDADAMVINPAFSLSSPVTEYFDHRPATNFLLAAHWVYDDSSQRSPTNFNAGVLVWNLSHASVLNVSNAWVTECRQSTQFGGYDDQSLLWMVIKKQLSSEDQYTMLAELTNRDPVTNRRHIAHILRSTGSGDWSGGTVLSRITTAKSEASNINWTESSTNLQSSDS
jgi:hypothetical protein